jgi:predicted O-methyltransferase YrrM
MLNWSHSIPDHESKDVMLKMLNKLKMEKPRILEIGTFTGVSIINMLNVVENSVGVCIDNWGLNPGESRHVEKYFFDNNMGMSDIKNVFWNNVKKAGVENRITLLEGDSVEKLLELSKNNETFNFIYVDGSHKCLDAYTDIVIAWNILEKGGIMAVDDYKWNMNAPVLERPYDGVNRFLKKYRYTLEILSVGYRIYFRKNMI